MIATLAGCRTTASRGRSRRPSAAAPALFSANANSRNSMESKRYLTRRMEHACWRLRQHTDGRLPGLRCPALATDSTQAAVYGRRTSLAVVPSTPLPRGAAARRGTAALYVPDAARFVPTAARSSPRAPLFARRPALSGRIAALFRRRAALFPRRAAPSVPSAGRKAPATRLFVVRAGQFRRRLGHFARRSGFFARRTGSGQLS